MNINSAEMLIAFCENNGIQLWKEGEKLKFKTTGFSMTNELTEKLKKYKTEILLKLPEKGMESIQTNQNDRYEPFPVSDVQSAYLLGRSGMFQYGDVACHIYLELTYDSLETSRVKKAWNNLIQRHDMLRAVIYEDGSQVVLPETPELVIPSEASKEYIESMKNRVYKLGEWPMFGVAVSDVGNQSVMHFSIEFLIADWTSIWMLLSEFEILYFKPDKALPEINILFRDYILQERKAKKSFKYEKDKKYWMEQIQQFPEAPQLPVVYAQNTSPQFKRKSFVLEQERWNCFKQSAKGHEITPTAAVLEAYAHVIEKWSSQKCFCLNLTVLNRQNLHPDINKVVGDFTTINLTKIDHREKRSFSEHARKTNQLLFENLDHSLYSGVEVLRELSRKNRGGEVLMPIVFTSAIGLLGENSHLIGIFENQGISQTPQVFIDCQVMDGEFGLQVNWDYREGVFPDGMLDDMFQAYQSLIQQLSVQEKIWDAEWGLVEMPKWQTEERQKVNDVEEIRKEKSLFEPFLEQAKKVAENIAVTDGSGEYTYGELDAMARTIAAEIVCEGGKQGDHIPIIMKKCRHQVAAVLGILYMGGIYVPIEENQAVERCGQILNDTHANIILTTSDHRGEYDNTVKKIYVDEVEQQKERKSFHIPEQNPNNPAYIIYTSGSTGKPKGVSISHMGAYNTIEDINVRFGICSGDCILGLSKLNFDLSVYDIFGLLSVGGRIIYPDPDQYMNPAHWLDLIQEYNISVWNSVPALMSLLLGYDKEGISGKNIKTVFLSGDWIPLDMPKKIKTYNPNSRIICMGGATEASIWSVYYEYIREENHWTSIPYGKPLTNQGLLVLNETLEDCPVWVKGDLYITGKGLALEYFGDQELTKEKFINHPITGKRLYKTGDIGRYLPDGNIEFMGREDNQIKINGHRIELGEIEYVVEAHNNIDSCIAFVHNNEVNIMVEMDEKDQYDSLRIQKELDFLTKSVRKKESWFGEIYDQVSSGLDDRNWASAISLLFCFQNMKLLEAGKIYTEVQINREFKSIPKYKWLIKPWLNCLLHNKLVSYDQHGYTAIRNISKQEMVQEWENADKSWNLVLGDKKIITYIEENAKQLSDILSGEIDPLGLLYPDGSDAYVRALYTDNAITTFLNQCMGEFLIHLSEKRNGKKLRILEIGAGSGATTRILLKALDGKKFEYCYTDVSKYFFQNAKEMFGDRKEVAFKSLNINQDVLEQGFKPNSYDVIIASYVLENAHDIEKSIDRIETLAAPQGYLLFASPLRDEEWLLASQVLMMEKAKDSLRDEVVFIDQSKWKEIISKHGDTDTFFCIPELPDEKAEKYGLQLMIKPFKQRKCEIDSKQLQNEMKNYLPEYMIPKDITIVDKMPLSDNGKIDRKKISEIFRLFHQSTDEKKGKAHVKTELQRKLADIFREVLNANEIGIEDNLYDFGADSLTMAQAAAKIRDEISSAIPFESLLRQILNTPTISELESVFSEEINRAMAEKNKTEQVLREFTYTRDFGGDDGNRVRVLLHNGLGVIENFNYLGGYLAKQNTGKVIAIGIADVETYCDLEENQIIEFLVETYVKIIENTGKKRVQLIGYCYSGTIAVEMARKLIEDGYEVDDVCVIDGGSMPVTVSEEFMNEMLFVNIIGLSVQDIGFDSPQIMENIMNDMVKNGKTELRVDDIVRFYRENSKREPTQMFCELQNLPQEERFLIYQKLYSKSISKNFELDLMVQLYRIFKQSLKVYKTPGIYFGNIRYFSVEEKVGMFQYLNVKIDEWEDICMGEFTTEIIQGNHFSCIENSEYAIELAGLLGR